MYSISGEKAVSQTSPMCEEQKYEYANNEHRMPDDGEMVNCINRLVLCLAVHAGCHDPGQYICVCAC